jgi:hypothetical protein
VRVYFFLVFGVAFVHVRNVKKGKENVFRAS